MKVLVTSASSLLGFHVARRLLEDGYEVVGSYRTLNKNMIELSSYSKFDGLCLNCSFESPLVEIKGEYEVIINSTGAYPTDGVTDDDILFANLKIPRIIAQNAMRTQSTRLVINFSSLSVYGDLGNITVINSQTAPAPQDLYGTTKLLSEQVLSCLHSSILQVINIRFPVVLCQGAHRAWLPTVRERVLAGREIIITNPHSLYNTCTTIKAVYLFCRHLMNECLSLNYSPTLPIGSVPDISIRELVEKVAWLAKTDIAVKVSHSDSSCVHIDNAAATSLGYIPPITSQAVEDWMEMRL